MNTHSVLRDRLTGRYPRCGAVIVLAFLGLVSVVSMADQSAATNAVSSVAHVPLSDVNLTSPEGMRLARDRLHAMADRLCAERGGRELSSQPAFRTCVDSTVANALRGINAFRPTDLTVRNSVTLGKSVSLTDLDLSTLEGERAAQQRLEAVARRLCSELARQQDRSYQPNQAACVHDTFTGAWAQANAIRAANDKRTAQRTTR